MFPLLIYNIPDTNLDRMSDDLISIFHKSKCNSGFISHLYHHELKHLYSDTMVPCGRQYRISPKSYLELPTGEEPATTLCQDLQTQFDTLLTSILHSNPHFVLCIKPTFTQSQNFDEDFVKSQCRVFNIPESINPMRTMLPYKMKMEEFYARYKVVARG